MAEIHAGVAQRLDEHLVLRSVADARDIERFAAFHRAINGADQGATCAALLRDHPAVRREHFLLVEDEQTGEIVSTTCLIPWQCRLEDVPLAVAMLEMVVTHPDYRKQGLVKAQIEQFHQTVVEEGFDLCIIEGIPYFYRQFSYGYALDHWAADGLPATRVPEKVTGPRVQLRPATESDIPALLHYYELAMAPLALGVLRSAAEWRYLLRAAHYPTYLIEPAHGGEPLGYVCGWRRGSNGRTIVMPESSIPNAAVALAVLHAYRTDAAEFLLGWPAGGALVQVGRSLGAQPLEHDQWLLRIPNLPRLLQKLSPVFARRLAQSAWSGFSGTLLVNLYHRAYALQFVDSQLVKVESAGFVDASMGADGGDLVIPPDAFLRLLLGYRSLAELRDAWPDIVARPERRHLLELLFPKFASYVWMPYLHCGHLLGLPPEPSGIDGATFS
ncbi:MAG TPA: GNAT family N-acetyltransferase [Caldilineaceae bacterium]|nr:GNAT family N-acetyltransferase [Caldilineaceae bacterium]